MGSRRAKRAAWWFGSVSCAVLALALVLGRQGLLVEWYAYRLASPDELVRLHAAERLGEIGGSRGLVRLLDAHEVEPVEAVRSAEERSVVLIFPRADGAGQKRLIAALEDARMQRAFEISVLQGGPDAFYSGTGPQAPPPELPEGAGRSAVLLLLRAAREGGVHASGWALASLPEAALLPGAGDALPLLVDAFREERIIFSVTNTLCAISSKTEEVTRFLLEALESPSRVVREAACHGLGILGKRGKSAVPGLKNLLRSQSLNERLLALSALASVSAALDPEVEAVAPLLDDPEPDVRLAAASYLGACGRSASAALPALRRRLGDSEPRVRTEIEHALEAVSGGTWAGEARR